MGVLVSPGTRVDPAPGFVARWSDMSGYVMLDRFLPVLVMRRVGPIGGPAMLLFREQVNERLRRSPVPVSIVYDVLPNAAGAPDAAARKLIADWMTEEAPMLRVKCASIEFAFPSTISRGVLTAILWMASPPMPTGVHGTPLTAIEAALGRTSGAREEASSILRATDALT
jgi:hypothetical protein